MTAIRDDAERVLAFPWLAYMTTTLACEPVAAAQRLAAHVKRFEDPTPVDEAWLERVFGSHLPTGMTKRYSIQFAVMFGRPLLWLPQCGDLCPCICLGSRVIMENPTQGSVRTLCKAMT